MEKKNGVVEIRVADLKHERWPGKRLGQDFTILDGKKVLTNDFLAKIKKSNLDILAVVYPKKSTDSYVGVTCRLVLICAKKESIIKVIPWVPWAEFCSKKVKEDRPNIRIEKPDQYRVLEIHQINERSYVRYRDDGGLITELQLAVNFDKVKKVYFGKKSKQVAAFLNKKK